MIFENRKEGEFWGVFQADIHPSKDKLAVDEVELILN
jgi:hypothetical protein